MEQQRSPGLDKWPCPPIGFATNQWRGDKILWGLDEVRCATPDPPLPNIFQRGLLQTRAHKPGAEFQRVQFRVTPQSVNAASMDRCLLAPPVP